MAYVFLSAWLGNVGGALAVYHVGRRYGADRLERMLAGPHAQEREARFHAMFQRYGIAALFVARFVPGVRALVPVVAGALRLPPLATTAMLTSAAVIWYGSITLLAFRLESDWSVVQRTLGRYMTTAGGIGAALLALAIVAWIVVRRRRPRR